MALPEITRRVQIGRAEAPMREHYRQEIEKFVRERVRFRPGRGLAEEERLGEIEAILVSREDPSLWAMIFKLGKNTWLQLYNNLTGEVWGLTAGRAMAFSSNQNERTVPLIVVERDGRLVAVPFHGIDRGVTYRGDGREYGWKVYGVGSTGQGQEMREVLLGYAFQFVNEWSLGNGAYYWQRYHQDYARRIEGEWARFR